VKEMSTGGGQWWMHSHLRLRWGLVAGALVAVETGDRNEALFAVLRMESNGSSWEGMATF
jgi:hypothetical protein